MMLHVFLICQGQTVTLDLEMRGLGKGVLAPNSANLTFHSLSHLVHISFLLLLSLCNVCEVCGIKDSVQLTVLS